jgi:hypothetical protein
MIVTGLCFGVLLKEAPVPTLPGYDEFNFRTVCPDLMKGVHRHKWIVVISLQVLHYKLRVLPHAGIVERAGGSHTAAAVAHIKPENIESAAEQLVTDAKNVGRRCA